MFSVESLPLEGLALVHSQRFADRRGYVTETWSQRAFQRLGIPCAFVQENQSLSHRKYTLRGLHFQKPPHEQAKLVRVLTGRIFDVAQDLRRDGGRLALSISDVHSRCRRRKRMRVLSRQTAIATPRLPAPPPKGVTGAGSIACGSDSSAVFFLHSKKSQHLAPVVGEMWRQELLGPLCGSYGAVLATLDKLGSGYIV
jgi:hypothetical protein